MLWSGAAGDPVTDGQTQTDMTGEYNTLCKEIIQVDMKNLWHAVSCYSGQGHLAVTDSVPNYTGNHVSSAHPDTCQSITHARLSCVVCVSKKQILCVRLGLDLQVSDL